MSGLVGVCELDSFSSRQAGAVGGAEGSMMRRGKRGIANWKNCQVPK
jgi:hypothetical protein